MTIIYHMTGREKMDNSSVKGQGLGIKKKSERGEKERR